MCAIAIAIVYGFTDLAGLQFLSAYVASIRLLRAGNAAHNYELWSLPRYSKTGIRDLNILHGTRDSVTWE